MYGIPWGKFNIGVDKNYPLKSMKYFQPYSSVWQEKKRVVVVRGSRLTKINWCHFLLGNKNNNSCLFFLEQRLCCREIKHPSKMLNSKRTLSKNKVNEQKWKTWHNCSSLSKKLLKKKKRDNIIRPFEVLQLNVQDLFLFLLHSFRKREPWIKRDENEERFRNSYFKNTP